MSSSREILPQDLPADVLQDESLQLSTSDQQNNSDDWKSALFLWSKQALSTGKTNLIEEVIQQVETILLQTALEHTSGHKNEAAKLLGWGRNTLAGKLKEHQDKV